MFEFQSRLAYIYDKRNSFYFESAQNCRRIRYKQVVKFELFYFVRETRVEPTLTLGFGLYTYIHI